MAIKWKDHFITTSGATGTYADPYGWNENVRGLTVMFVV